MGWHLIYIALHPTIQDKLLHPRIQDSNITLTEVHSQATGKEIYFQTWAGIKKKRGISSQMGSWAVWVRVCVSVCAPQ